MNKFFLFSVILFSITFLTDAQDIIYFHNGFSRKVEIISSSSDSIIYKTLNKQKTVRIKKNKLLYIKYNNGDYENSDTSFYSVLKPTFYDSISNQRKNIAEFYFLMVPHGVALSYERLLYNGRFGLKFPLSYIFLSDIETAVAFLLYPLKQKINSCFIGPKIVAGYYEYGFSYGAYISTGFRRRVKKKLVMAIEFNLGKRNSYAIYSTYAFGGISAGYNF